MDRDNAINKFKREMERLHETNEGLQQHHERQNVMHMNEKRQYTLHLKQQFNDLKHQLRVSQSQRDADKATYNKTRQSRDMLQKQLIDRECQIKRLTDELQSNRAQLDREAAYRHIHYQYHDMEKYDFALVRDTQQQQMKRASELNEANNSIHVLKSRVTELEHEIFTAKQIGHRIHSKASNASSADASSSSSSVLANLTVYPPSYPYDMSNNTNTNHDEDDGGKVSTSSIPRSQHNVDAQCNSTSTAMSSASGSVSILPLSTASSFTSDYRSQKHRLSDAKRHRAFMSAIAELDTLIHHDHHEESSRRRRIRNHRPVIHNVLYEAAEAIEEMRYEKEILTKKIQELHHNDNSNTTANANMQGVDFKEGTAM
jgi:hypothetical protein